MIEYTNKLYIRQLCAVIAVLLVFNLYLLAFKIQLLAIIPILLQSLMITMIVKRSKHMILLIKIWAILMLIGGGFGLIQVLAEWGLYALGEEGTPGVLSIWNVLTKGVLVAYPIYVLIDLKSILVTLSPEEVVV